MGGSRDGFRDGSFPEESLRLGKAEGGLTGGKPSPWPHCELADLLHLTLEQEHHKICFMAELGPLWRGESREAEAQAPPSPSLASSLLLALSKGILAPEPESFFYSKIKNSNLSTLSRHRLQLARIS